MSRQPKRYARIEIVEADVDWHEEVDLYSGRVWTDKPAKSLRPHYLRLVAGNGRILAHSETYANLTNARRAVDAWLAAFDECTMLDRAPAQVVEVQS